MKNYIIAFIIFIASNYGISILSYYYRGEVVVGGEFLIPSILFAIWIAYQEIKSKQKSYQKKQDI